MTAFLKMPSMPAGVASPTERAVSLPPLNAIKVHSQKDIDSGDPFIELLKDADVLDRYLHWVKEDRKCYIERYEKVLTELGVDIVKLRQ